MVILPIEIISYISKYTNIYDICTGLICINKQYSFESNIRKSKFILNVIKLQSFYKKNPPVTLYDPSPLRIPYSKKLLVRGFIARYPMVHLKSYPEFLTSKIHNLSNQPKIATLEKYIEEKMPIPVKRTRRDLRDFLGHQLITIENFNYVGW